jgi:hypothetical protein
MGRFAGWFWLWKKDLTTINECGDGVELFGLVHGSQLIATPPSANSPAEPLETLDGILRILIESAMPSFCVASHVEGA